MNLILSAVIVLGGIALVASVILYICSKRFAVYEDPRIAEVSAILPGANCGGCGFPGCSGMADALVKAADGGTIDGLNCPVGGQEVMSRVATALGMAATSAETKVAVVRCNGSCEKRSRIVAYDGLRTCTALHACGAGETACGYGCLGCGDCVAACAFGAIVMDKESGLPVVDEDKCTACGACAKACPRHIIELRKKGVRGRRIYVSCVNRDKGAAAMKACKAACIACGKCEKECKFDAITIGSNVSYIDATKCRLCRKCVDVCPTHAIVAVNFPASKPKPMTATKEPVGATKQPITSGETTVIAQGKEAKA